MSKAEKALKFFENFNCAQSVLAAYTGDFDLEMNKALQVSAGFGGGMGRLQETCGAVTGAIMVLGLSSQYKETDGGEKKNEIYANVRRLVDDFTKQKGTVKCRDLLGGCELKTEEGQKYFHDHNLKDNCRQYIRLCCELLEKYGIR